MRVQDVSNAVKRIGSTKTANRVSAWTSTPTAWFCWIVSLRTNRRRSRIPFWVRQLADRLEAALITPLSNCCCGN